MKKLKTTDVKGFVAGVCQPYTDYNQDIIDWLEEHSADETGLVEADRKYIFCGNSSFYTHDFTYNHEVYYPNEQFMELIGMTKKNEFDSLLEQAHSLVKRIEELLDKAKSQIDYKQQAIQKELEFAEAKKQRLENHINVLKSKLK